MKELVLFNGAAKIISAGLSTFGLAGVELKLGIFSTILVVSLFAYAIKKSVKEPKKPKELKECCNCRDIKEAYGAAFLIKKEFINIVSDLEYRSMGLKTNNRFLIPLVREATLKERIVDFISRKQFLRLKNQCSSCILDLSNDACEDANIYTSVHSKSPVSYTGGGLTPEQRCTIWEGFIIHFGLD